MIESLVGSLNAGSKYIIPLLLVGIPLYALIYLSVLTVLAEVSVLAVIWSKGNLTDSSLVQLLARKERRSS